MTNYLKTILLLGVMSVLLIFVGNALGGQTGVTIAFFFALIMNFGSFFFSDKIALRSSGAVPLNEGQAPEIYKMTRELAQTMNIPMPKLYIIPSDQANAFATGRDPHNSSVAVTSGITQLLTKEEIKAVIAHELGHIKNRDILLATIAAVLASTISFLANMGSFGLMGGSRDEERPNPIFGLLALILAPLAATILQLALSREREFKADNASKIALRTGDPLALALVKIHKSASREPMDIDPSMSSLFIGNPLGQLGGFANLFATHPPVEERIKRLKTS